MDGSDPLLDPLSPIIEAPGVPDAGSPVLRNTLFLTLAQVVGMPLTLMVNAVTARYLGPAALGYMYIGATFNGLGFLAVDWGQSGALPALVATDRSAAGRLLGASLAWRVVTAFAIYWVLLGVCYLLGYGSEVRVIMSLYFVGYALSAVSNACQTVMIGFERIEIAAYRQMLEQSATLLVVVPILVLGGGVNLTLVGHAAVTIIVFVYICRVLPSVNIGRLSVDRDTLNTLFFRGTPFVFLSVAMVLQPSIDAAFLSKLASVEAVGWYSAARRLIGFLVFPAAAIVGAMYPTICRLHATDAEGFRATTSDALRATSLLVIPVALGCALYPDIGIALYNRNSFLPAEDNLRVLSLFLFLLYFSMPVGICIMAAGKQRAWAAVQFTSVAVSVILDPILVPLFQRRTGNGGLGLCVAAVISEIIVLVCAGFLVPSGIFTGRFWRSLLPALASGAAMVLAAVALRTMTSFLAAPVSVVVYLGCLWMTGGIDKEFVAELGGFVRRKLSK